MSARFASSDTTDLRKVMEEKIPLFQEEVKQFRKDHGNKVIGEITVDQVGSFLTCAKKIKCGAGCPA